MGSTFSFYTYNQGPFEELEAFHEAYREEECYENGNDPYAGHLGILQEGLALQKQIFNSEEEARNFIEQNHYKCNQAMAAPYKGKAYAYPKSYTDLIASSKKAENDFYATQAAILQEIKAVKSKTISCKACGSVINRQFIADMYCPVCREKGVFYSKNHLKRLEAKSKKLRVFIQIAPPKKKELVDGIAYVVGGWCPT
jgi:hypothetical protein